MVSSRSLRWDRPSIHFIDAMKLVFDSDRSRSDRHIVVGRWLASVSSDPAAGEGRPPHARASIGSTSSKRTSWSTRCDGCAMPIRRGSDPRNSVQLNTRSSSTNHGQSHLAAAQPVLEFTHGARQTCRRAALPGERSEKTCPTGCQAARRNATRNTAHGSDSRWIPNRRPIHPGLGMNPLRICSWAVAALFLAGPLSGALAATKTWTGNVDALWSTPGNWAGGVPVAGDRIAFPVSASNPTNTNDLAAGTVFFDITFLGSNYIINGNAIGLSDGIPGNNGFSNRINADLELTANQSIQGAFCCAGLTLAGSVDIGANAVTITGATVTGVISGTRDRDDGRRDRLLGQQHLRRPHHGQRARADRRQPAGEQRPGQRHAERRRHGRRGERGQHAEPRRRIRRLAGRAHHLRQPRLREQRLLHGAAQRAHRRHRLRPDAGQRRGHESAATSISTRRSATRRATARC